MTRAHARLLTVCLLLSVACVAVSCGTFSGSDTGGEADGGPLAQDASSAGADAGDSSVVDSARPPDTGAPEAGCSDRWCTCFAQGVAFCDDFDRDAESVGDLWSLDASAGDGSVLTLDTVAQSPPHSVLFDLPQNYNTQGGYRALLSEGIAPLTTPTFVSFDLLITNTPNNCAGGNNSLVAFVRVAEDFAVTGSPMNFAAIGTDTNGSAIFIGSVLNRVPLPAFPRGAWIRVGLETRTYSDDAGAKQMAAVVRFGDAGSVIDHDAAPAATASAPASMTGSTAWASVGALDLSINSSAPCEVHIDNVTIEN